MVGRERRELALGAGEVADAQHRASADGAPLGGDMTLLRRRERQRKGLALRTQRADRRLHRLRILRREPCAEGEHATRQRRAHDDRNVPADVRLIGARGPHHDHLRLGEQQRVRAVAFLAQFVDLGLLGGELLGGAPARAQERDGGRDREQDDAERERQRGDFVPFKRRDRIEIGSDGRKRRVRLGVRRHRQEHDEAEARRAGCCESFAPRMRLVSAPFPDRVRHFRAPARQRSRPGHGTGISDDRELRPPRRSRIE
jgi:hypothetical protein